MKKISIQNIKPLQGILDAKIFENELTGLQRNVFFGIVLPLGIDISTTDEPLPIVSTSIMLDFVRLNIKNLNELENRSFQFPINPESGYIDGSVYLFDAHNMLYVSELRFGKFKNQSISIEMTLQIDFEMEGTGFQNTDIFTLKSKIALEEFIIWDDILAPTEASLEKAKSLAMQYLDVSKFGEPFISHFGIRMAMKV